VADETSFNRLALKAPLPTVVVFHAPWCDASRASLASVERLAAEYAGRLRFVTVDTDESRGLAEQFGVWALPTYLAFRSGDELARGAGLLPHGLLRLFAELALARETPLPGIWHPTEQQLEDEVLLPMLERWGWSWRRQEPCVVRAGGRARRGVIDILAYTGVAEGPLTLFENKRLIATDDDLRKAVEQARGYAQALELPTFVVADPGALWVYALRDGVAAPAGRFAGYELERDDTTLRELVLELGGHRQ
jgi:thioredoxin-like negative regulator of GroEL